MKYILLNKYDITEPFYNNIARVGLYGKNMKVNKQGIECLQTTTLRIYSSQQTTFCSKTSPYE